MSGRLPYAKRPTYPHMVGEDAETWSRFIDLHPFYFDSCDYDFRVGEGEKYPQSYNKNYQKMVTQLSQLRIDILGWKCDSPTIVEVKSRGVISAAGQLQGYQSLFVRDLPKVPRPGLLLVCDWINDDALHVFISLGIPVEVVGIAT